MDSSNNTPTLPISAAAPAPQKSIIAGPTLKTRFAILLYLKSIFMGCGLYYGICAIPLRELVKYYRHSAAKSNQLFSFGLALGSITRISDTLEFSRALELLLK